MADQTSGPGRPTGQGSGVSAGQPPPSAAKPKADPLLTQYQAGGGAGVEELRKQVAENPDNETFRDWLAFALYTNNVIDEAISMYEGLIVEYPTNANYHYYLGNSLAKKGNLTRALEEWKTVVTLEPPGRKLAKRAQERVDQAQAMLQSAK